MLPRSRRIPRGQEPKALPRRTISSGLFRIKEFEGRGRAAIVISRKVSPLASIRNALKRQISAVLEETNLPGKDIIVFVHPEAAKHIKTEVRKDLARLLGQIN